ncbi:sideroflexin-1 isoform X1 [Hyaena hyaena]|uniref:sideroflexin-1 isoform X1 n=1 Tax=Hyaena hyaena TaxID=95912 RepID=UPI001924047A|nr:sideroflexin-1 isoform X1 [Hyaena hyaena]XP_039095701.1 sideroflexin-1 isoform X1 [Hyaena hyaena]
MRRRKKIKKSSKQILLGIHAYDTDKCRRSCSHRHLGLRTPVGGISATSPANGFSPPRHPASPAERRDLTFVECLLYACQALYRFKIKLKEDNLILTVALQAWRYSYLRNEGAETQRRLGHRRWPVCDGSLCFRTTPAVLFWQWINQSFNAVVNYTNRSGDAPLTVNELGTAYVSATTGAVATALGLNALTKHVSPLIGRFVPFAAVAAANCINIPLMRQRELKVGIPVTDENGNRLGESANAARQAITQVVISRILMAAPGMAIPPFIMNTLEKKAFLKRFPWMSAPIQVGLVGFCLVFATPLCCALFPQKSSMSVTSLEAELQAKIRETCPELRRVYFNKGL